MSGLLERVLVDRVIVAIDPGKVLNRVWVTDRGWFAGRAGVVADVATWSGSAWGVGRRWGLPVFALEATGSLHRAWAVELERRWPGSLRLFAPSQTQAARTQLGTRRFKTDDRDCAALVWLARQGAGQPARSSAVDALRAAVAHRRQLVLALTPLRQRLHDQLNALAPGLSAPEGHGRACRCITDRASGPGLRRRFRGPSPHCPVAEGARRGPPERRDGDVLGRRWKDCLRRRRRRAPRRPDARDLARFDALREDIAFLEGQIEPLLADSAGQILTSLPGVWTSARQRSPRTRCPSSASRPRNSSTPPPASRPPAISPPPSAAAAESHAPACPSTATR